MRRKKHSLPLRIFAGFFIYLGKGIFYFFKGIGLAIYYTGKGFYNAATWSFKSMKSKKSEELKALPKSESGKGMNAASVYTDFNIIKTNEGDYSDFESNLFNSDSSIGLILGARGSGKSAVGMKLLENIKAKTNRKIFAIGFKQESLPSWIKCIDDISEIENNSAVLIDEGGITFSSRESMSNANKLLSSLLFVARHKNLHVLFISQNSSNLEINAIRQADYLVLKPSSLLQKDFERKKIKEIYSELEKEFQKLKKEHKGITYIYSDKFRGFVDNPLPSFWSAGVSKAFSGFKK